MLRALGLDHDEEQAYRHLMEQPSTDAAALAEAVDIAPNDAAHLLSSLEDKGLVARMGSDQGRFVASPPGVALGALMAQQQEELRRAQAGMTELMGRYRGAAGRDIVDIVEVVHGVEAIAQRFAQLQLSARELVQSFSKVTPAVVNRDENEDTERSVLARGVTYELVLERAEFDDPSFHAVVEEAVEWGAGIRIAPTVPLRMLLVDREVALVPLVPEGSIESVQDALLVHPSGLLDGLMAVFDSVWHAASAVVRSDAEAKPQVEHDQLDEVDAKVLGMLLAGLTDQSIGVQLDLSLRTVQRRVRQMMDRAGVQTRLQLGFEAARRGWA